jgi:hypothetical protein
MKCTINGSNNNNNMMINGNSSIDSMKSYKR